MPFSSPSRQPSTRAALAPGILGAIILLVGLALVGESWYLYILYAACVLALVLGVFAGQARRWWWLAGLLPIAVLWNPIWPITAVQFILPLLSLAAAIVFVAAGVSIKIPADAHR